MDRHKINFIYTTELGRDFLCGFSLLGDTMMNNRVKKWTKSSQTNKERASLPKIMIGPK